jgi:hypothetical protein
VKSTLCDQYHGKYLVGFASGLFATLFGLNGDKTKTKRRPNPDQAQAKAMFCVCFVCVKNVFYMYLNTANII